jgi:FixJ family two-component response regulator
LESKQEKALEGLTERERELLGIVVRGIKLRKSTQLGSGNSDVARDAPEAVPVPPSESEQ